jgi:hypothetical protein
MERRVGIMKIRYFILIFFALFLMQCTTLTASEKGGGGTQGVAIEPNDSMPQTWMLRTWKVDSLGDFDSTSSEQTLVHLGEMIDFPTHSAVELRSIDGHQIIYIAPRNWEQSAVLKLNNSMVDSVVQRSIVASHIDSLRLENSPYIAQKSGDQFELQGVPQSLRVIETHSENAEQLVFIKDTSVQKVYEVAQNSSSLSLFPNVGYIWQGDSSILKQDTNQLWWGNLTSTSSGIWSLDSIDSMLIYHKLKSDNGFNGVYRYSFVMDVKFDSTSWWIPLIFSANYISKTPLYFLSPSGEILDYLQSSKSSIKISKNQWHRMAFVVDMAECHCVNIWLNGLRFWELDITIPKPHSNWSELIPGSQSDFILDSYDKGNGRVAAFSRGPNSMAGLDLKGLTYIQGLIPDSLLAQYGKVKP